jgi:hypothetical protein
MFINFNHFERLFLGHFSYHLNETNRGQLKGIEDVRTFVNQAKQESWKNTDPVS